MQDQAARWDSVYESRDFSVFSDIILQKLFRKYHFTGTALDIGCGTGELAARLSKAGLNVMGIDLSPVAIAKAKQRTDKAKFEVQDVFEHQGQYDLVVAKLVYALMPDQASFLVKVKSLLKPNGHFLIETPVRFDNYEHDKRWTSISVPEPELIPALAKQFNKCELIDTSYQDLAGAVQILICS